MAITVAAVENSLVEIISADRASAWSRAANRVYEGLSASEVIRSERLDYDVWKEPMLRNGGKPTGYAAIVARYKGYERVYGATKDYTIVHINSLLQSLDDIPYPVESALALQNGRFVAINYDYGRHWIVGEEYNLGLTILHPYQPGFAWRVMITPVRLKCMNAIIAAKRESVSDLRVWHRSLAPAKIDLAMLQSNAARLELNMRNSLEGLARLYIGGNEEKILHKVYGETAAGIVVANLYRRFENEYPEFRGTGYALYQATCEAEDYRPVRKNQTERSIAESALVGTRSMKKIQMFDTLVRMN